MRATGRVLENSVEALRVELTYHSNAIEGSTLTLRETQLVIEGHAPTSGKTLREIYEARNHDRALRMVESWAATRPPDAPISEADLLEVHGHVLADIDPRSAGRYRADRVLIKGSRYVPPGPHRFRELIPRALELAGRAVDAPSGVHPLMLAAELHYNLVAIHPFSDGNGRTARLMMNLLALRAGFPHVIIDVSERAEYLAALEEANAGACDRFGALVVRGATRSIERLIGPEAE